MSENRLALSLFWRTFILLGLLLTVGIVAWVQTFRALEFEPRAVQSAQQVASLVNLSRAALRYADSINRVTLIKALFDQESITLKPSEPADSYQPFEQNRFTRTIAEELRSRLERRGEDAPEVIDMRMKNAAIEVAQVGKFDFVIINELFDRALFDLKAIVHSQRLKVAAQRRARAETFKALHIP